MKELTITKKYLVFSKEDFVMAQQFLDEEAFFGDSMEELRESIDSGEEDELCSIVFTKSYGIQFHNNLESGYDFVAVEKPEDPKAKK